MCKATVVAGVVVAVQYTVEIVDHMVAAAPVDPLIKAKERKK